MNKLKILYYIYVGVLSVVFGIYIGLVIGLSIAPNSEDVDTAFEDGYNSGYNQAKIDYNEENFDDIIDLLIENAVLKERIEWLENTNVDIDLIMEDVDDLVEIIVRYYESEYVNIMTLEEYIQWKDPNLYQRILNEWK